MASFFSAISSAISSAMLGCHWRVWELDLIRLSRPATLNGIL